MQTTLPHKPDHDRRFQQLQAAQARGEIAELVQWPRWQTIINTMRVTVIDADFQYRHVQRGTTVAEFVNPKNSALHALTKRLLRACHQVEPEDVRA